MDQQTKKHLQEEFDAALEEKDQLITVLQTQVCVHFVLRVSLVNGGETESACLQVSLLKKRLQASGGTVSSEAETSQSTDAVDATSDIQSPSKDDGSTLNTGVCGARVTCFYTRRSLTGLFVFCVCGQQRAAESRTARWTSSCFRSESKDKRVSCRGVKR